MPNPSRRKIPEKSACRRGGLLCTVIKAGRTAAKYDKKQIYSFRSGKIMVEYLGVA